MASPVVGVIANPASARDIRRVICRMPASSDQNAFLPPTAAACARSKPRP